MSTPPAHSPSPFNTTSVIPPNTGEISTAYAVIPSAEVVTTLPVPATAGVLVAADDGGATAGVAEVKLNPYDPVEPCVLLDDIGRASIKTYPGIFEDEDLQRVWNEDYQAMYDEPVFNPHELNQANALKNALFKAFEEFTARVAAVLVEQLPKPVDQWVIKPLPGFGVAGGEKFVVGQVFCKFARDDKRIYGSDELAIKMAKNEIRNVNAVMQLGVHSLHSSLMASHRIKGHVVITTAKMPVSAGGVDRPSSLVYGSGDAARTLHRSNDELNGLVDRVAAQLGLAAHAVRNHPSDVKVSIGADCEGHVSFEDGRHYLLDLGRLLPPNDTRHPYTLVWQFRPEYMRWRVQQRLPALSSDAFTRFGVEQDNPAVLDAIRHYFDEHMPQVVQQHLISNDTLDWRDEHVAQQLSRVLHQHGINMRHLGRVFNLVAAAIAVADDARKSALRSVLLREMTVRSIKSMVLRKLRSNMEASADALFQELTAADVLSALKLKYPDAALTDQERKYITDTLWTVPKSDTSASSPLPPSLSRASLLSVWSEVRQAVTSTVSDVVMAPDFPNVEQAEQRLNSELELRALTVGEHSPALLSTMDLMLKLYKVWHADGPADTLVKAERLMNRMLKIADTDELRYSWVYNNCGMFWHETGHLEEAASLYERSLRADEASLGERHPHVATSLNNLAIVYRLKGDYAKAQPLYERALRLREEVLGDRHPDVASSLNNLAILHKVQGDYATAEPLYQRALRLYEEALGERHPQVANSLNNLANLYCVQGDFAKAEPLFERALRLHEKALGERHPDVAYSLNNLANLYNVQGDYAKAEPLYERALRLREEVLGERHPDVATSLDNLAIVYEAQGRIEQALPMYLRALQLREEVLGPHHPEVASSCNNLGCVYRDQCQLDAAEELLNRALSIRTQSLPAEHPLIAQVKENLQLLYSKRSSS